MAASQTKKTMEHRVRDVFRRCLFSFFLASVSLGLVSSTGCLAFVANFVRVIKGNDSPAEFDEFKDKKVAVLAITPAGYNADASGIIMSSHVHALLATNVKKIQMVNQEEVSRIISDFAANEREMSLIGKRLGADYLIAVEVKNLKLKDGQTLYRGSSTSTVSVYKVEDGSSPVFQKVLPDFIFPTTGFPITDTDEATFQRFYLAEVAQRMARHFYPYDPSVDVAKDASVASLQTLR
jgi:hypothetical protein